MKSLVLLALLVSSSVFAATGEVTEGSFLCRYDVHSGMSGEVMVLKTEDGKYNMLDSSYGGSHNFVIDGAERGFRLLNSEPMARKVAEGMSENQFSLFEASGNHGVFGLGNSYHERNITIDLTSGESLYTHEEPKQFDINTGSKGGRVTYQMMCAPATK